MSQKSTKEWRSDAIARLSRLNDAQLKAVVELVSAFQIAGPPTPAKAQVLKPYASTPTPGSNGVDPLEKIDWGPAARKGRKQFDSTRHTFVVEAFEDLDAEDAAVTLYFSDEDDAVRMFRALDFFDPTGAVDAYGPRFVCVRLSSYGSWETRTGRTRSGWVSFWWNKGFVEHYGDTPSRGYGVPEAQKQQVRYTRLPPAPPPGGKSR